MTTASDQIYGALRLIGQVAEGETISSEMAADSLLSLNQMLDSWSISDLDIYSTQDQQFTWPGNIATRTLGATGNFVGSRPTKLSDSSYFKDSSGNSYWLTRINEKAYNSIAQKTSTSTFPEYMFVNMTMPDITITLYPVPSSAIEFHFVSDVVLSQLPSLGTSIAVPPGYLRAIKYNLALELAPEFGVEPSPTVKRTAVTSLLAIRKQNQKKEDFIMLLPGNLQFSARDSYSIFSG